MSLFCLAFCRFYYIFIYIRIYTLNCIAVILFQLTLLINSLKSITIFGNHQRSGSSRRVSHHHHPKRSSTRLILIFMHLIVLLIRSGASSRQTSGVRDSRFLDDLLDFSWSNSGTMFWDSFNLHRWFCTIGLLAVRSAIRSMKLDHCSILYM